MVRLQARPRLRQFGLAVEVGIGLGVGVRLGTEPLPERRYSTWNGILTTPNARPSPFTDSTSCIVKSTTGTSLSTFSK